ncbi:MAG: iron-containing alcohol dehydrogenase [Caldilineaceae bacterium]|nr:iron-containing alcohol dehydrogenase [Caldilineaceae bacterium]
MWFFSSPEIIFGEDALSYLEEVRGARALIVTDPTLHKLGFTERIGAPLRAAGLAVEVFAEVEPEPSLQTVRCGVERMRSFQPDWIVGLGGGSAMDAAKAMWALYERPDLAPEEISPVFALGLHKVKMIAIPTTSGTGSEATWATVLTDVESKRKLALGNRELTPTLAIVDPALSADLPPHITADTGLDVLTHAIEGYSANFHSDFTDPLCLKAAELVFAYLPRAVAHGSSDPQAREKMANAATIAGLGFGNSLVGLAHALGHSFGGIFKVPHGRAVSLFLPYVIEFSARMDVGRYDEIARYLRFTDGENFSASATALIEAIRCLQKEIGQPTSIAELGIAAADLEDQMDLLCANAIGDNSTVAAPRPVEWEELQQLFLCAYAGKPIDF